MHTSLESGKAFSLVVPSIRELMNKLYLDGQKQVKNILGFRLAVCFLCSIGVVWPYGLKNWHALLCKTQ